ncbi:hypothetical protein ABZ208_32995 [Streptomyces sp. NPDC006208]|uniref:hypothetical protein n=1 Tax=Streptomyces sp. NPDC006208 TaxID=3156734 RepID=UPI0033BEEB9B
MTAVLAGGAAAAPAVADDEAVPHPITCGWKKEVGTPYSLDTTKVAGFTQVQCSDRLDDANTTAQIQYLSGTSWRDRGAEAVSYHTGSTSASGGVFIHVYDSTTKVAGAHLYRTKGTHFGQHGNIWTLPTYYSPTRYLTGS